MLAPTARRAALTAFALTLTAACAVACGGSNDAPIGSGDDELNSPNEGGMFGPQGEPVGNPTPSAVQCSKMDIVFIVDNSRSMREEQANLARNFPRFIDVIDSYETQTGLALDYRVAVTTTDDIGNRGAFVRDRGADAVASCSAGPDRRWLERSDGDVASMFACRAQRGTTGTNIERPLESMELAVTERIEDGTNVAPPSVGFVRDDALLAFVVITDEDEGGVENKPARDVGEYITAFDRLKGDRSRWASAIIAGETKCKSEGLGDAAEAVRLKRFVSNVGENAVFSSICSGDLSEGLEEALRTFDHACKNFTPPLK